MVELRPEAMHREAETFSRRALVGGAGAGRRVAEARRPGQRENIEIEPARRGGAHGLRSGLRARRGGRERDSRRDQDAGEPAASRHAGQ